MPADIVLDGEILRFLGGDGVDRLRMVPEDGRIALVEPPTGDADDDEEVLARLRAADDGAEGELELRASDGRHTTLRPGSITISTDEGEVELRVDGDEILVSTDDDWRSLSDHLDELERLRDRVTALEERIEALESTDDA